MNRIYHLLKKEFLVISRDVHAVAVLFVMPMAFILIMSLAMQDLFSTQSPVRIPLLVSDRDGGKPAAALLKALRGNASFEVKDLPATWTDAEAAAALNDADAKFVVLIEDHFSAAVRDRKPRKGRKPLVILVNPVVGTQMQLIVQSVLANALGKVRIEAMTKEMSPLLALARIDPRAFRQPSEANIEMRFVTRGEQRFRAPNAVQQSVPAWLVFSMFFIVIPISNTFISERSQGTLQRLRSIRLSRGILLLGKMLPYFFINLIQVALMLLVGMYLVPALGGSALTLGNSPAGLALIAAAVSFSSIALALLIAVVARTTEQATTLGGLLNIVFAAAGGVMIPKFVMPAIMQKVADLSPMSWGLEGFLDILLRNGGVRDVLPECLALAAFGAVMLLLTAVILKKQFEGSASP